MVLMVLPMVLPAAMTMVVVAVAVVARLSTHLHKCYRDHAERYHLHLKRMQTALSRV